VRKSKPVGEIRAPHASLLDDVVLEHDEEARCLATGRGCVSPEGEREHPEAGRKSPNSMALGEASEQLVPEEEVGFDSTCTWGRNEKVSETRLFGCSFAELGGDLALERKGFAGTKAEESR